MIEVVRPPQTQGLTTLWQNVLGDLRDVFDVHYVCASFARHIARHASARVIIAIADSDAGAYNLWLADETGETRQHRWTRAEAGFEPLLVYTRPILLDKLERPAVEVIASRLWLETRRKAFVTAITPDGREDNKFPTTLLFLLDPPESLAVEAGDLQAMVDMMCVFLDRAALREEADRRKVEFAVVSDAGRALSSTLNVQEIYEILTGPIRWTLNVEALSIGLVEPVTEDIVFVDRLLGPMFERLPPVRLKRGQGIAGWVAQNKEPVIINNAYSDKRFFSGVDQKSGFRTSSMICIPLTVDERTIGVLQAINRQYGKFTDHDLELMQAIGGPLAAAIENANLNADVLAERRLFESLFDGMAEGLVSVNREGVILRANKAFATFQAVEHEELAGGMLRGRFRAHREEIDELIAGVFAESREGELLLTELPVENGRALPMLISGVPVAGEDGTVNEAILVFSDLTQIREVERMREDLFQGILRELHTPMATILMYSRLLREGRTRHPEKAERFLGVIERESDRLQRMIRQLLKLSQLESRESGRSPQPVWLNPMFDETLPPLAERAVQKGLLYRQKIEADLPPVIGNIEAYNLALWNVLDNAIKFTPSGSVQVAARQENGAVVIEVSDEGIGIPPEAIAHLFKRFYRAQTAIERGIAGTGLGLYMVKESLRHYNGEIGVTSTPGKGTVFTIRLPVAQV